MINRPFKRYLECVCGDDDHTIYTDFDPDPDWEYFMVGVQLAPRYGFFMRIWLALRYIFKPNENKYSHWHTVDLNEEGVRRLKSECDKFLVALEHQRLHQRLTGSN